jgi:hypothetical protein
VYVRETNLSIHGDNLPKSASAAAIRALLNRKISRVFWSLPNKDEIEVRKEEWKERRKERRERKLNAGRKKRREWVWKAFQLRRLLRASEKYDLKERKKNSTQV